MKAIILLLPFRPFHSYKSLCKEAMKILNVAEKNDAAKNIANLLSNNRVQRREGKSKFNKIYEFQAQVLGQRSNMIMTSVSGHLTDLEFIGPYKGWTKCSPEDLFHCPINRFVSENFLPIKKTLEMEVKNCDALIIWTDCDREGENIGFEIIDVCLKVKPRLTVYRAKFSEITEASIKRALASLERPDKKVSDAVSVRSELDFRIGCAFTRFQTLRLSKVFPALAEYLLSYGPCQFPTLGFVVERYLERERFIPESFWKIKVIHAKDNLKVEFLWKRNRLFDEPIVQAILRKCEENPTATVESMQSKPKNKWRPTPLDTTEMEKTVSRKLKINAKETMKIAEKLYTQGFISYPRTETNIFPDSMDLAVLVQEQRQDSRWGGFAGKVLDWGPNPRQGKKSDQSHPPIHPLKFTNTLSGNEGKVYEFIVRHFLACVSKDAVGQETTVVIDINGEKFTGTGLMILEKNYLEVYTYESWSAKAMHIYNVGQRFEPTTLDIVGGQTTAPNLLTEADLISLMEKHGIGTDATHAEHIETIKARLYVGLEGNGFVPSAVGMGLVEGYDSMGFEMSKPKLRSNLESDLVKICDGSKRPENVLREQIDKYHELFRKAKEQIQLIDAAMSKHIGEQAISLSEDPTNVQSVLGDKVLECKSCKLDMTLVAGTNGRFYINCVGFPRCKSSIWIPNKVISAKVSSQSCSMCGPNVKLIDFKFQPGSMIPYYPNEYTGCVKGCDKNFVEMLGIKILTGGGRVSAQSTDQSASSQRPPPNRNNFSSNRDPPRNDGPRGGWNDFKRPGDKRPHKYVDGGDVDDDDDDDNDNGDDPSSGPRCSCGELAVRRTVRKEGPNTGRDFYVCAKDGEGKCTFYLWADAIATDGTKCFCGLPAQSGNVRKEGPNQGRPFLGCSKFGAERCQFFLWADEDSNNSRGQGGSGGGSGNYNRNNHSSQYRRGGPPPNKKTRPAFTNVRKESSGNSTTDFRAKSSSSKKTSSTETKARKCGLCGETGHNRRSCPQNN